MHTMLTSFLPKGRAIPQAVHSAPAIRNTAHPGVNFASARSTQADVFVKRNATPPRFTGAPHPNEVMDDEGTTWIHYAALAGDIKKAKELVKQSNVNYEEKNKKGLTPLTVCAVTGKLEVAKLYREHGAKLQVIYRKDASGKIDLSKDFIHPSDLAKKHGDTSAIYQFFLNEEKEELAAILAKK